MQKRWLLIEGMVGWEGHTVGGGEGVNINSIFYVIVS